MGKPKDDDRFDKIAVACPYCGQNVLVPNPFDKTEEELEEEAIRRCYCVQAKSHVRKMERRENVENYIEEKFPENLRDFVRSCIEKIEGYEIESVKIKDNDGWTHEIHLDKNAFLVMSPKKILGEARKF